MNTARNRVLVLENQDDVRDVYVRTISRAGFNVDGAGTLSEAIERVDERTYAVAVVDLMLDDPHSRSTFEGAELLKVLGALDEGTNCIILSGQDRPKIAADLARQYRIYDYVEKASVATSGSNAILGPVRSAASDARLPGIQSELSDVQSDARFTVQLFGDRGEDSSIAETNLLGLLKPTGGVLAFRKACALVLAPYLPVFGAAPSWTLDRATGMASKKMWSKGIGAAVLLTISRSPVGGAEVPSMLDEQHVGVWFNMTQTPGKRSDFGGRYNDRRR